MKFLTRLIFILLFAVSARAEQCLIVYGLNDPYAPYEWIDEKGKAVGMNIDLLKAVAQEMGCRYEIKVYPYAYEYIQQKLKDGTVNMMSLSQTKLTDKFAINIQPTMVHYGYIFNRDDSPAAHGVEDLRGKTVFVPKHGPSYEFLESVKDQYSINMVVFDSRRDALKALANGEGDAFISTFPAGTNVLESNDLDNIRSTGTPVFSTVYGFAVNRNDMDFYKKINDAMQTLKDTGEYFEIVKKWSMGVPRVPEWLRYIFWGLGVLITTTMLVTILMWNKSLQVQVRRKTHSLNEEIAIRQNAEKGLKEISQLFQKVLNTIPENIYLFDKTGKKQWVNHNRNTPINIVVEVAHAFEKRAGFNFSRLSEDARTWRVVGVYMDNEHQLLVIMADMTENVKLRDEAFMAARLAAIGEMAASVAHEINNPTGIILHHMSYIRYVINEMQGFVEEGIHHDRPYKGDLPWEELKLETEEACAVVDASLTRIKGTVDFLKNFCVTRSNSYELININDCISSAIKFSSFFLSQYTKNFKVDIKEDQAMVYGNALQIEQVLINLFQNACRALTKPQQNITCTLCKEDRYIKITVADEGCGMDKETKARAWDAFFTTRKEQGGTGLGLAITSRIMKEHKGIYELSSTLGQGTEVTLYFPAAG